MPLIIKPTFQAGDAEADFNKWMAELAKKANLPVKPTFVPPTGGTGGGDPMKPLQDGALKAGAQIEKLQAQLGRLFEKADFNTKTASLDALRERAEKAELEFAKAKVSVQDFSASLSGIDFAKADPQWAAAFSAELSRLGDTAKTSLSEAAQATKEYEAAMAAADEASAKSAKDAEEDARKKQDSENIAGIAVAEKVELVRGVYNDLRDVFDITTVSLLGFSEAEAKTASETAYLAEKAVMVGLGIGGWPGLLAAAGLGLAGVVHWETEAAKRTEELRQRLRTAQDEFRNTLLAAKELSADQFDFEGAAKSIDAQKKALDELGKAAKKAEEDAKNAVASTTSAMLAAEAQARGLGTTASTQDPARIAAAKAALDEAERAQRAYNQSVFDYYDITQSRSQGAWEALDKQKQSWEWIGKNRPAALVAKDLEDAHQKASKFADAVAESDAKIAEMERIVKEGDFKAYVQMLWEGTDATKDMAKEAAKNAEAHSALQGIFATITALMQEQNNAKKAAKDLYAPIKDAKREAEDAREVLKVYQEMGTEAGKIEEAFRAARGDKKLSPKLEEELRAATKAAQEANEALDAYKEGETQLSAGLRELRRERIEKEKADLLEMEEFRRRVLASTLEYEKGLIAERNRIQSVQAAASADRYLNFAKPVNDMLAAAHLSLSEFISISSMRSMQGITETAHLTTEQLEKLKEELGEFAQKSPIEQWAQKLAAETDLAGASLARLEAGLAGVAGAAIRAGDAAVGAIGGAATGAFGELFEAMAKNEAMLEPFGKAFQRKAAEALRATGSELIGDGTANVLKAGAMTFIPGLQGNALGLAAAGGAEIVAGLAMGGVGVGIGRRVGAAPEATSERGDRGAGGDVGPSRAGGDSGPRVQAPIVINMTGVPFGIMTEREKTEIGERISQSLTSFHANGGPSFPV